MSPIQPILSAESDLQPSGLVRSVRSGPMSLIYSDLSSLMDLADLVRSAPISSDLVGSGPPIWQIWCDGLLGPICPIWSHEPVYSDERTVFLSRCPHASQPLS